MVCIYTYQEIIKLFEFKVSDKEININECYSAIHMYARKQLPSACTMWHGATTEFVTKMV